MSKFSAIYTLLLATLILDSNSATAQDFYSSRLCIERPGETGRVNITPVTIRVQDMAELTTLGEQEVCIGANLTENVKEAISLKFPFPYSGPAEKLQWWETTPISVPIKSGKMTRLLLCERDQNHSAPRWTETGWHDMWMLLPPSKRRLCAQ